MDMLRSFIQRALDIVFMATFFCLMAIAVVGFWTGLAAGACLVLWEMWSFAAGVAPTVQDAIAAIFPAWLAWSVFATVLGAALVYTLPTLFTALVLLIALDLVVGGDKDDEDVADGI